MKSALIFVIVSLCIFSQSHAAPRSCDGTSTMDGKSFCTQRNYALPNTGRAHTHYPDVSDPNPRNDRTQFDDNTENPYQACCRYKCGHGLDEYNFEGSAFDSAATYQIATRGYSGIQTMPHDGTVENGFFYYSFDVRDCRRIEINDLEALKTALSVEDTGISSECTTLEEDNNWRVGKVSYGNFIYNSNGEQKAIAVEELPKIKASLALSTPHYETYGSSSSCSL